jgi:signal transduction protein with GAF and PtsI domain
MNRSDFEAIATFGKKLSYLEHIEDALVAIANKAKELLSAERCSIFLVDSEANILWTRLSNGIGRIAIGLDSGIAGLTYQSAEAQIINDPYNHPHFLPAIDEKSGYKTHNLIAVPIFGSEQKVIGVIQLLNKRDTPEGFNVEDKHLLTFLSNYVSGTLELALKLHKD